MISLILWTVFWAFVFPPMIVLPYIGLVYAWLAHR